VIGVLPSFEATTASDFYTPTRLIQPAQKTARLISGVDILQFIAGFSRLQNYGVSPETVEKP
jgi:hypothetical protein